MVGLQNSKKMRQTIETDVSRGIAIYRSDVRDEARLGSLCCLNFVQLDDYARTQTAREPPGITAPS